MTDKVLVLQFWEESERGWGTRPDGVSLHLTEAARKAYIYTYWEGMPDEAPDEYSRPQGNPLSVTVTQELFDEVLNKREQYGVRYYTVPEGVLSNAKNAG